MTIQKFGTRSIQKVLILLIMFIKSLHATSIAPQPQNEASKPKANETNTMKTPEKNQHRLNLKLLWALKRTPGDARYEDELVAEDILEFIRAGADVNCCYVMTPLMHACARGRYKSIQVLIQAGADVNARDSQGGTALMEAAQRIGSDSLECVKALLAAGADVNTINKNGWTALKNAASQGSTECIKTLIAAGADVNADDTTALMLAAWGGEIEKINALIAAGAHVNAQRMYDGQTALMMAADSWHDGHVECITNLIKAGADVNTRDNNGRTAIFHAAEKGNVDFVNALINAGAHVNITDHKGESLLSLADYLAQNRGDYEDCIKCGNAIKSAIMKTRPVGFSWFMIKKFFSNSFS